MSSACSAFLDFDRPLVADAPIGPDPCPVLEPNGTLETALAIAPGENRPLAICPAGDKDFYKFTVTADSRVVIEAVFVHATGNLDLRLWSPVDGKVVAESTSAEDIERIECPGSAPMCAALAPGDWVIEVSAADAAVSNGYRLRLVVER